MNKPQTATIDVMALKTSERSMFEKQTIFDGSLKNEKEETFIELEEEDDIDISKFQSTILKPKTLTPVEERPILHSYTENTNIVMNVKRKCPENIQPASKRIKN